MEELRQEKLAFAFLKITLRLFNVRWGVNLFSCEWMSHGSEESWSCLQ